MNRNETIQLLTLMQSFYDNMMPKNDDAKLAYIDVWHDIMQDIEFIDAQIALKEHMKESVYVPKVADIYQRVMNKRMPNFPDPVGEWNKVLKACNTYGYHRSDEAMKTFGEMTKKVVEAFGGFRKICTSEVEQEISDRKHFVDVYNRLIERETKQIKQGNAGFFTLEREQKKEPTAIDSKINSLIKRI